MFHLLVLLRKIGRIAFKRNRLVLFIPQISQHFRVFAFWVNILMKKVQKSTPARNIWFSYCKMRDLSCICSCSLKWITWASRLNMEFIFHNKMRAQVLRYFLLLRFVSETMSRFFFCCRMNLHFMVLFCNFNLRKVDLIKSVENYKAAFAKLLIPLNVMQSDMFECSNVRISRWRYFIMIKHLARDK